MEERVFVESIGEPRQQYIPDAHLHETPPRRARDLGNTGAAVVEPPRVMAVAEPLIVAFPLEVTERFIKIIDAGSGGRVVTMIEVLSPSNKLRSRGREEYLCKQQDALVAKVNLVEIDLLRVGEPTTLIRPALLWPEPPATYHASTYRPHRGDRVEYYALPLRERLPRLPIPLRPTDPDAILDLQAVVDQAYDRGRYDDIDYARPLVPPLDLEDAAWANEAIRAWLVAAGRSA